MANYSRLLALGGGTATSRLRFLPAFSRLRQHSFNQRRRHRAAPNHPANSFRENKVYLTLAGFFVDLHGNERFLALRRGDASPAKTKSNLTLTAKKLD